MHAESHECPFICNSPGIYKLMEKVAITLVQLSFPHERSASGSFCCRNKLIAENSTVMILQFLRPEV